MHCTAATGRTPVHIRRQGELVGLVSGQQSQSPDMTSLAWAICGVMVAAGPLNRAGTQPIQRPKNNAAMRFGAQCMTRHSIVGCLIASIKNLLFNWLASS